MKSRTLGIALAVALGAGLPSAAQSAATAKRPHKTVRKKSSLPSWRGWKPFVNERFRAEDWHWFPGAADSSYGYAHSLLQVGATYRGEKVLLHFAGAQDTLLGLPTDATAPGAQGQLGQGASYSAANGGRSNIADVFLKQAFATFDLPRDSWLQAGRFGFNDGAEYQPTNPVLKLLTNLRISQRLIGEFGFSAIGRSFDGAQFQTPLQGGHLTITALRPTEGVFQVNAMKELPIDVLYGSYIHTQHYGGGESEFRLFSMGYDDQRTTVLKTDNRLLATRKADQLPVKIGTYGADYAAVFPLASLGKADVIGWGAVQNGRWGTQRQRAGAFFAEAGLQPQGAPLKAWISGGFSYGSGDSNPGDGVHGTFMQMLPTPRLAARFPFYNMENNEDLYASLVLHPVGKLVLRSEAHVLKLANAADFWYLGGGAFQGNTFGYVGRPSGGARGLANVGDLSADFPLTAHLAVTAYVAHAWGQQVMSNIYPNGSGATFAYLETNMNF